MRKILADRIGCAPQGVADYLFPIDKGYTEQQRADNMLAIYMAMQVAKEQGFQERVEQEAIEARNSGLPPMHRR